MIELTVVINEFIKYFITLFNICKVLFLFMNITNEKLLEEVLSGQRAVVELSDQSCRSVLLLLVQRIQRENRK